MIPLGAVTGPIEAVQPVAGSDLLEATCGLGSRPVDTTEVDSDAIGVSRIVLVREPANPKRGRAECGIYAGGDALVARLLDRSCDPDSHDRMQPPDRDLDALSGHGVGYASLPLLGRGADQVGSGFVYDLLCRWRALRHQRLNFLRQLEHAQSVALEDRGAIGGLELRNRWAWFRVRNRAALCARDIGCFRHGARDCYRFVVDRCRSSWSRGG